MDHTEGVVHMIPILQVHSLLFLYPHHYFSILALKTSIILFIIWTFLNITPTFLNTIPTILIITSVILNIKSVILNIKSVILNITPQGTVTQRVNYLADEK